MIFGSPGQAPWAAGRDASDLRKTSLPVRALGLIFAGVITGPSWSLPAADAAQVPEWLDAARCQVVSIETQDRPSGPLEGLLLAMPGESGGGTGRGAGFRIGPEGWVVSSAHVVQDAWRLRVRTHDGQVAPGRIVGFDRASDLALIAVEGWAASRGLLLADDDRMAVGDAVLAIGHPLGL